MSHLDNELSVHRQTWDLLPWYVNGRSSDAEKRIVEQHLAVCSHCKDEFEFQHQLAATLAQENDGDADPHPSLQQLWAQIDARDQYLRAPDAPPPIRQSGSLARWLVAAVVIESIGLTALSTALWDRAGPRADAAVYQTLTASQPTLPGATLRVVLDPTMSLKDFQALLEHSQMQVLNGPSHSGIYTLGPTKAQDAATAQLALIQMRAQPGVRLAEPIKSSTETE